MIPPTTSVPASARIVSELLTLIPPKPNDPLPIFTIVPPLLTVATVPAPSLSVSLAFSVTTAVCAPFTRLPWLKSTPSPLTVSAPKFSSTPPLQVSAAPPVPIVPVPLVASRSVPPVCVPPLHVSASRAVSSPVPASVPPVCVKFATAAGPVSEMVPLANVTLSSGLGTTAGDQFPGVNQSLFVAPVHV